MKYVIGDKVRVKKLVEGKVYGAYGANHDMCKYSGGIVTIGEVFDRGYKLVEDDRKWNWTDEMFTGKARLSDGTLLQESIRTLSEELNRVTKESYEKLGKIFENGMESINNSINKRTLYDDAVQEEFIKKAKEISLEELKKDLHEDMKEYVKENYGIIPKRIEVARGKRIKKIDGIFHKEFENICKIVDSNIPLMLVGGAGAGKNYTLEQVSKALGLTFYTTNAINQEYKLTGFIDANGKYHETEFYKAFTKGGIFFLDEVDASSPEALIILNGAIANKYFDFPTGREIAHKDFRVVCAGNTYGTGADMVYVGRNVLDGATLDRFVVLEFDYDEEVEKKLAYDDNLYKFIKNLRETINKVNLRYIVSMRALINASKLLELGVSKDKILRTTIIKDMQKDDLNIIIDKIDVRNDWYDALKGLCD